MHENKKFLNVLKFYRWTHQLSFFSNSIVIEVSSILENVNCSSDIKLRVIQLGSLPIYVYGNTKVKILLHKHKTIFFNICFYLRKNLKKSIRCICTR